MSQVVDPDTSTTSTTTDELIGLARLVQHAKDNNIAYLVGMLVAYQMGILEKLMTYGSGICG